MYESQQMDLITKVPQKNALYDGQPQDLKLAFGMRPFVLPTGKFVSILLPDKAKPPAFLLRDVKLPWGWHEKYRTISIPAEDSSEAAILAERLGTLATKASALNAEEWFGKPASVVHHAVTVRNGVKEYRDSAFLVLKAPGQDEEPEFYDMDGKLVGSDLDLRNAVCDVLFVTNGCFLRGLDVFVQAKCVAIAKKTQGTGTDLERRMQSFAIVE